MCPPQETSQPHPPHNIWTIDDNIYQYKLCLEYKKNGWQNIEHLSKVTSNNYPMKWSILDIAYL